MTTPEVTPYTAKKQNDAMEGSSETAVGLQRMTGNQLAMGAASSLGPLRSQLEVAGAAVEADQATEADCISASKKASQTIANFNEMALLYGEVVGSHALSSIIIDGDGVAVAEQMTIPVLHGLHDPIANALAALGTTLVKDHRAAEKAQAKATAKAEASAAVWSQVYGDITERIKEGRALQTSHGLEVPKRKAPYRKLKGGAPVEPTPVEAGTPVATPVTSTPTPVPAPQPVNSSPMAAGATGSGPPADPTKVAG